MNIHMFAACVTSKQVDAKELHIITVVGCILHTICIKNDALYYDDDKPVSSPFSSETIPNSGIIDYLKRISKYTKCSPACFVIALIYIKRILVADQHAIMLNTQSVHRLCMVSMTLAMKYHEDNHYSQAHYANVGAIPKKELNDLERFFVKIINWNLHVNQIYFMRFYDFLLLHIGQCEKCHTDVHRMPLAPPIAKALVTPILRTPFQDRKNISFKSPQRITKDLPKTERRSRKENMASGSS